MGSPPTLLLLVIVLCVAAIFQWSAYKKWQNCLPQVPTLTKNCSYEMNYARLLSTSFVSEYLHTSTQRSIALQKGMFRDHSKDIVQHRERQHNSGGKGQTLPDVNDVHRPSTTALRKHS